MGHHVWGLGEEYAAAAVLEEIDTAVVPPNNRTIPLVGSAYAVNALAGASAILTFGDSLERHAITANTATSVTVDVAFSQSPVNDSDGWVQYQFAAECAVGANPNFCIMEHSRGAAGTLDAAGTWTPAAHPVTEFCSPSNHDPDGDTQQEKSSFGPVLGDDHRPSRLHRPGHARSGCARSRGRLCRSGLDCPRKGVALRSGRRSVRLHERGSQDGGCAARRHILARVLRRRGRSSLGRRL